MSRIVYYKLIFISFLVICDSTVFAKLLRPLNNKDQKEKNKLVGSYHRSKAFSSFIMGSTQ